MMEKVLERNRIFRNGIIGFAVGDALGAPAEFGERWMRDMDPVKEMRSGGIFDVPEGGWTDDTSMTVATLVSLKNGFDLKDMMERFISWYRTGEYSWADKPIGIGKQILKALEHYEQEQNLNTCGGRAEEENGNGSLMRVLPVCLYGYQLQKNGEMNVADVICMVHDTSALTHAHIRSKIACGLYYFIICGILEEKGMLLERIQAGIDRGFSFYKQEPDLSCYIRLKNLTAMREEKREQIQSTGYVVDTLEAVIWCLLNADTFKSSVLMAVNLGLDTDTIAAITGSLAGLYYGYNSIPPEWIAVLKERRKLTSLCDYFDR